MVQSCKEIVELIHDLIITSLLDSLVDPLVQLPQFTANTNTDFKLHFQMVTYDVRIDSEDSGSFTLGVVLFLLLNSET